MELYEEGEGEGQIGEVNAEGSEMLVQLSVWGSSQARQGDVTLRSLPCTIPLYDLPPLSYSNRYLIFYSYSLEIHTRVIIHMYPCYYRTAATIPN